MKPLTNISEFKLAQMEKLSRQMHPCFLEVVDRLESEGVSRDQIATFLIGFASAIACDEIGASETIKCFGALEPSLIAQERGLL